jgi:hypothetical protein
MILPHRPRFVRPHVEGSHTSHVRGLKYVRESHQERPQIGKRCECELSVKELGKVLIDCSTESSFEGMTVEPLGNLYLAVRSLMRPGILVFDPDYTEMDSISTGPSKPGGKEPKGIPSNCCFRGGADGKVLIVTVDVSLYCNPLTIERNHVPLETLTHCVKPQREKGTPKPSLFTLRQLMSRCRQNVKAPGASSRMIHTTTTMTAKILKICLNLPSIGT